MRPLALVPGGVRTGVAGCVLGAVEEPLPEAAGGRLGRLEFDAYLMWTPKIAPTEHQGVLIRIHGASGSLFDSTFMRYQVSEQTRNRQTTCEIFVRSGLEGALNIDRESFNFAHPHVVFITNWLHSALRRLATTQKSLAKGIREENRREETQRREDAQDAIVSEAWDEQSDFEGESPPPVTFDEPEPTGSSKTSETSGSGGYRMSRPAVFGEGRANTEQTKSTERLLRAIGQLLAAYGFLDTLQEAERERLFERLRRIIETEQG